MKTIRTFLVDDEAGALQALQAIIAESAPGLEIIGTAGNVEDAHSGICRLEPDLLFLDIQLGEQTGFDLLNKNFDSGFEIIFVTAYDQYAIEAFRNNALSYLLKPVIPGDLEKAVKRAAALIRLKENSEPSIGRIRALFRNRVAITQGSSVEYLNPDEIIYIKADGSYCEVYLADGKMKLISKPLKFLEERIHSGPFFRAHRSYLVNAAFIHSWDKTDGGSLIMAGGSVIPLSAEGRKLLAGLTLPGNS